MRFTRSVSLVLALLVPGPGLRAEPVSGAFPRSVWIGYLHHPAVNWRLQAVTALGEIGPASASAVADLVDLLGDEAPPVSKAASETLVKIGADAVPVLLRALEEDRVVYRLGAARTLGQLTGPACVAALAKTLGDADPEVRLAAVGGLVGKWDTGALTKVLAALLPDDKDALREEALKVLGRLGPVAAPALPELRALLKQTRPGTLAVVETVRQIGTAARPAAAELKDLLSRKLPGGASRSDSQAWMRLRVGTATTLLALEVEKETAWAVLAGCLDFQPERSGDNSNPPTEENTHLQAVDLLVQAGAMAVPALTQALAAREDRIRAGAVQALAQIDKLPEPITRVLRRLADEDVSTQVRRWAVLALARQGLRLQADDIEELLAALQEPGGVGDIRRRGTLWLFDWRGAVIPTLARHHSLWLSRPAPAPLLGQFLGSQGLPSVGAPLGQMTQILVTWRATAFEDFTLLGRLFEALQSEKSALREGAAETLAAIALEGEAGRRALRPAVALLKERTQKEDPGFINDQPETASWAGAWSAVALARLGAEQRQALEALLRTRNTVDSWNEGRHLRRVRFGAEGQRSAGGSSIARLDRTLADALGRIEDKVLPEVLAPLDQPIIKDIEESLQTVRVLLAAKRSGVVLPRLLRQLADNKSALQATVAEELVQLSLSPEERAPVIQALLEALEAPSALVRVNAARALVKHKQHLDQARAVLLDGLDSDQEVSRTALPVLLELGIPAEETPRLLALAVRKDDADLLRAFFRAAPEALPLLEAQLAHADPAARPLVANALMRCGPAGVPGLTRALAHRDPGVRQAAACALRGVSPLPAMTLRGLRKALRDPDPAVVLGAAVALAQSSELTAEVVPILVQALRQGDQEARLLAVTTLGRAGDRARAAVPEVKKALADGAPEVRLAACRSLPRMGEDGRHCLPELLAILTKDPDLDMRRQALAALRQIARGFPAEQEAIARALLLGMEDADPQFRREVGYVLYSLQRPKIAPIVLPRMVEEMRDPNTLLSGIAEELVRNAGAAAVPYLAKLLEEPNVDVRTNAIDVLSELQVEGKLVVPVLLRALSDKEGSVREAAYLTLGNMNKGEAVPALIDRLLCERGLDRIWAVRTLGRMGKPARAALPALLELLKHPATPLRGAALRAVMGLEPDAKDALDAYTALLRDPEPNIRFAAVQGLAGLKAAALPALLEMLEDTNAPVRIEAIGALKGLKPPADKVLPVLCRALKDPEAPVRTAAALALAELGSAAAGAAAQLTALLGDPAPDARAAAARALGIVAGREAAPALKPLLRDRHEPVRRAAAAALANVAAAAK